MSKQEKEDKRPIDMNTDEAIDYVFGAEIADELSREAGKCEPPAPEEPEAESEG